MDLKFSFNDSNPPPASQGAGSASAHATGIPMQGSSSSMLELRVSLTADSAASGYVMVCEGFSADGVSYGRAEKPISDDDPESLAAALKSVLARCGAELPEPLLGSVSAIVLDLSGKEGDTLTKLGLSISDGQQIASVDDSLQARTGITVGTPMLRANH